MTVATRTTRNSTNGFHRHPATGLRLASKTDQSAGVYSLNAAFKQCFGHPIALFRTEALTKLPALRLMTPSDYSGTAKQNTIDGKRRSGLLEQRI